jgi:hypothetical protein
MSEVCSISYKSYISPAMNVLFRNTVSILLLCFYLASGALIELTHHDEAAFASQSEARVDHHDCGGPDQHPTPEASHCLACTQKTHRVAIETQFSLPLQTVSVIAGRIVHSLGETLDTDILYSGKRGPPSRIA